MATTLTPPTSPAEADLDEAVIRAGAPGHEAGGDEDKPADEDRVDLRDALRPALAAGLASAGAALVAGGIFGSWAARVLGVVAVALGVAWALLALRAPQRSNSFVLSLLPVCAAVSVVFVVAFGGDPSQLPTLVGDAVESGRLLRPPVPFDPGWIPIVFVVFGMLGFCAASVATALDKARVAIAVPLPVLGLAAMTQPDDGQFIAGVCAFVPLVAALAVMFGGDGADGRRLTKDFELKRAGRGLAFTAVAVAALFALGNANVLFPEPVFDPDDQPQKPRPLPLSQIDDVVLFEVKTDAGITGPWRTGVLDVYDGEAWRLPPFDKKRLVDIPSSGIVDATLSATASVSVAFTTRGLQNATTLPGLTGAASIERSPGLAAVQWDPRAVTFRVAEGRLPNGAAYTIAMPPYPDATALGAAPEPARDVSETLSIPSPPRAVRDLLAGAPASPPYARMDFLRTRLRDVAVASGGGVPVDISPARVAQILTGPKHEATPFEIVAADAMLARWAGVPSRIGFGFDGLNDENGVQTVRPRNAAQWLEVYFEGHGWVPLIQPPEQAKTTIDNEDQLFDPNTLATDEVAVDVYVPVRLENFQELYQRIRAQLVALAPFGLGALALYFATPYTQKQWRRYKRRRWAAQEGPVAQVVVEYAEFRDLAHDLNLGDPLDTPLEFLQRVVDDDEHQELAWLTARVLYGDMPEPSAETVRDAEDLSASLRRRILRGQPFSVRVLGVLSKASLRDPYTDEVPSVVLLDPLGRVARFRRRRRTARRGGHATRRRFGVPRPDLALWRRP